MSGNMSMGSRSRHGHASRRRSILLWIGLLAMPWAAGDARAEPTGPEPVEAAIRVEAIPFDAEGIGEREATTGTAGGGPAPAFDAASLAAYAAHLGEMAFEWYRKTPPGDRVAWGGLAVCCLLGLSILLERSARLRERKIIPSDFTAKFLDRLHGGKLDAGSALDYCEENPSPAARVALAAVRRWGRPAADLERAVGLAHRVEADRLTRNVGTLRRIAALSPLLGFLGTLLAAGRTLAAIPPDVSVSEGLGAGFHWGPELASALATLTAGIVIATLAIVAYDGIQARIERLIGALDRLGAETIDAIAMTVPQSPASLSVPASRAGELCIDTAPPHVRVHPPSETPPIGIFGLVRPPRHSPAASKSVDRRSHRPA